MGIIGKAIRGADIRNSANYAEKFSSWFSPTNIFDRLRATTLASNETIFSAVSRLSNSLASLPLKLNGADYRAINSPIADLLANAPNPNQTSFDFVRNLESHRDTNGNGYASKDYDVRFQVRALWILDPSKVQPVIEATTKELWYQIQGDVGIYYIHNLDMIHVKHIHTTGYKGVSPLDVLKNTTDFDTGVKEFSLDQVEGAVRASFILKMAAMLKEDKKEEIVANFQKFYQENGGVLIQEQGIEITPIEQKFIDTKVFETEKITRARVASVYNMPARMLGETEGGKASSEQDAIEFVQGCMLPIVRQYEQEFNRKLLTPKDRQAGQYFKFSLNALLRADTATRGEFYFKGIRSGFKTPNEVRALEDDPPVEGGDQLYMSRDLSLIGEREKQDRSAWTENEKRQADGLEPLPGGDAVYKPASEIPAIEAEESLEGM